MTVQIREYSPIDAFLFDFSEEEEIRNLLSENINHFLQLRNASTITFNGKMIAIFFYNTLLYGVAEICMYTSTYFFKTPVKEIIKATRKIINIMSKRFQRLQAIVSRSLPRNQRYITHFGFVQEGVLKSFGHNKEDYILYAKII
jgi:hypothetical protein